MAKNPYIESLATPAKAMFMPSGWVETAWFDGALMEMPKYLHSIYIVGENISSNNPISVWYKILVGVGRNWERQPRGDGNGVEWPNGLDCAAAGEAWV